MRTTRSKAVALLILAAGVVWAGQKTKKPPPPTALDLYIRDATQRESEAEKGSAGSLYSPSSPLANLARDPKAAQVDDMVTIVVADKASALSSANTTTDRKSSAKNSVTALLGQTKVTGPLANLTNLSGDQSLQGQGATSRQVTLNATVTARVTRVLPNGYLVVEGAKTVVINSESQVVSVRGVVRPADIVTGNFVQSDRLADLEVKLNGRGVVGDAVRRPNFLYRLLLGVLPF